MFAVAVIMGGLRVPDIKKDAVDGMGDKLREQADATIVFYLLTSTYERENS
jgi:hypothetical protein